MADSRVRIVIDVDYDGRNVRIAEKDMEKFEKAVKEGRKELEAGQESMRKWSKRIGAAGVALGVATIAAFQHGAEVDTTAQKYDALTGSIGASADVLLGEMRTATRGYMTDAALMSGASELINVGIAGNAEEVGRFSSVIGGLGLDMQQLTLTIVNQSKMRLDALGLSVSEVDARYQALRGSLPDEEAWKIAVLESLEAKMSLMEGTVSDSEDAMRRLGTEFGNAGDEASMAVAEGFTPTAEVLALILQRSNDIQASGIGGYLSRVGQSMADQALAIDALDRGAIGLGDFFRLSTTPADANAGALARQAEIRREQIRLLEEEAGVYDDVRREIQGYGGDLQDLNRMAFESHLFNLEEQATRARGSESALERLNSVTGAWSETMERGNEHIEASIHFERQAAEARERQTAAIEKQNAAMGSLFAEMAQDAQEDFIKDTETQASVLFDAAAAADANALQLAELGLATGMFTEEQAEALLKSVALKTEIERLGTLIGERKMSIPDALEALDDFKAGLDEAEGDLGDVAREIGVVEEGMGRLDGTKVRIDIDTYYREHGQLPPGMGIPDTTQGGTRPQANAMGTSFFSGGASFVGERGPELVSLPRGVQIDNAPKTRAMGMKGQLGGGDTHYHLHAGGSGTSGLQNEFAMLQALAGAE